MQHGAIIISFKELRARAAKRPEGYFEDVVANGNAIGESVQLTPAAHRRLVAKYQVAKPASEWPVWAKLISHTKTNADVGVGDTVLRLIGEPSSAQFKAWYRGLFGRDCGCTTRQSLWNTIYPYQH
jgi:hypothetical protein